jgi:hypothetical protein
MVKAQLFQKLWFGRSKSRGNSRIHGSIDIIVSWVRPFKRQQRPKILIRFAGISLGRLKKKPGNSHQILIPGT